MEFSISIFSLLIMVELASSAFTSQGAGFRKRPGRNTSVYKNKHCTFIHSLTQLNSSFDENDVGEAYDFFDDDFDMQQLRKRIATQVFSYEELFDSDRYALHPEDVHIILFNPDTDDEGVHTIEFPKGSGNNVILAFESKKECERFSGILKDQQFFDPSPQAMKLEFLETYCKSLGVRVQVVPEGMIINPPKQNVEHLGLNPDLKKEVNHLDYLFQKSSYRVKDDGVVAMEDGVGAWD